MILMCLNKSRCMIQQKSSLFSRDGLGYSIVNCKINHDFSVLVYCTQVNMMFVMLL